jgi:uncharacterized protein involved in exopolysaccharide biosynthesis
VYDTLASLTEEIVSSTLAHHWAGKLEALQKQGKTIDAHVVAAQDEYGEALNRLSACRLTQDAQSPDIAEAKVEEDDDIARVLALSGSTDNDMNDGSDSGSE